ncbi:MAG: CARDB domain-containing protein [Tepidisphaeraceae bacterium]
MISPCAMSELESRRLLAVDLLASVVADGFFGPNDVVGINITVKNAGTTSTNPPVISANLYLSTDTTFNAGSDILLGEANLGGLGVLAGGAERTISKPVAIAPSVPAGDYHVIVVIDQGQAIAESNENNNIAFTSAASVRIVTEELTNQTLLGTAGDDVITIEQHEANTIITVNGVSKRFEVGSFDHVFIDGGSGNDRILVTNDEVNVRLQITGSGGNDTIVGGGAGDELSGANGKDRVSGGEGDDYLLGGASADYLSGEAGNDTMSGAGGKDRLADVFGRDHFIGGGGNDVIICRDVLNDADNDPDTVSGGLGDDRAQVNENGAFPDGLASIEQLIA